MTFSRFTTCDFYQHFPSFWDLLIEHFFDILLKFSKSRGIIM